MPNSAISGQLGLERCDGALSLQRPRSQSRLTTSATKTGRCVVSTAEPHLASDCSALALQNLSARLYISIVNHVTVMITIHSHLNSKTVPER